MIESLILFLPLNLGKHFVSVDAFVRARLSDYLVPTIWLQDILILGILAAALRKGKLHPPKNLIRIALVFIAVFLPSVFVGENTTASAFYFFRLILYVLFALFVASNFSADTHFPKTLKYLSISVILLGILAVLQWKVQGAVFNNYAILGEQPYDSTTFNVARVSVFGQLKIPAYGLFRHPNTFAGFLTVALFWIYSQMQLDKTRKNSFLLSGGFAAGFLALVLTFSQVAMVGLFLSMVFFLAIRHLGKNGVLLSISATAAIFIFAVLLPVISTNEQLNSDPSFYRRSNLLKSSYEMVLEHPIFGVGMNNYTIALQDYLPLTQVLVFNQPVHNIFALVAAESGVLALVAFLGILALGAFAALNNDFGYPAVFFISILQLIIIGSFDHYFYTAHQTQILFWLTLGFALAYTNRDAQV